MFAFIESEGSVSAVNLKEVQVVFDVEIDLAYKQWMFKVYTSGSDKAFTFSYASEENASIGRNKLIKDIKEYNYKLGGM